MICMVVVAGVLMMMMTIKQAGNGGTNGKLIK